MLKKRIIPILLWDGKQAVQTTKFARPYRPVGSMMQHIEVMESRNIDELIMLDIVATTEKRKPLFNEIKEFTSRLFCPVTIGGGISELDDIKRLIQDCGADKVSIKTNFSLINSAAKKFGSQAIIYSMDIYENKLHGLPSRVRNRVDIKSWAKLIENQGAGEILLTDIDRNGTQLSYNHLLIQDIAKVVTIPIIANGGCHDWLCMKHAFECGASACAASTMFLFTEWTPKSVARKLREQGVSVRLDG